jgi:hypothetical protein
LSILTLLPQELRVHSTPNPPTARNHWTNRTFSESGQNWWMPSATMQRLPFR